MMVALLTEVKGHFLSHHTVYDLNMLLYRAGCLLDPCLDPEGRSADVLKAEVVKFGDSPELAEASGFGGVHKHDLRASHDLGFIHLHIPID